MQHTNTSSMSGGSTTSLFYRDLGARWLTTRSKKGIRRSNKNRLTLSKTPIFGWWRPAWNLSFEARVGILASYSTETRPDSMRLGVKVSSSTARQLDRPRQNSTDLDRAEPIRTSLLEPHSFKVKVDGDPLVNYTTWWLDDGFTSGGPFVPRSVCSFVLFLT